MEIEEARLSHPDEASWDETVEARLPHSYEASWNEIVPAQAKTRVWRDLSKRKKAFLGSVVFAWLFVHLTFHSTESNCICILTQPCI